MKIKKGDKVKILSGKDRGKTGAVDQVLAKENKVLIGGLNLYKKHLKPQSRKDQKSGGIISFSRAINVSKVALICSKCNLPAKIGYSSEGKDKIRICKKCNTKI